MKTKKSLLVVPAIAMVFALVFTTCSNGGGGGGNQGDQTETQGQLAFERITSGPNAGTWRVRKGTFKGGALVIPAYYNGSTGRAARGVEDGDPVTEIGASTDDEWSAAFVRAGITSVTIPDTVKVIGQFAFGWNNELTSVIIPASVTEIWSGSFPACPNLAITVEEGNPHYSSEDGILYTNVITIPFLGILAYTDNEEHTILHSWPSASGSVTIKEGVTKIYAGAFYHNYNVTSVTIPSSVTTIDDDSFTASNLKSITIPQSVTEIGQGAFSAVNLTSITIPASVKYIGDSAFRSNTNLTSITVESGNLYYEAEGGILYTNIKDMSRYWNENNNEFSEYIYTDNREKTVLHSYPSAKGSITIKEGVTEIKTHAFSECENLTGITIPTSVTYIHGSAFQASTNISSITIPSTVKKVGSMVFSYWTSKQTINVPFASQEAADAAWPTDSGSFWDGEKHVETNWRSYCNAKINYNGS
jgi:hypothetical protein